MVWNVEYTNEFAEWYRGLSERQQDDITASALLLMELGPQLPSPIRLELRHRSTHTCEPRVQSGGRPLRVFYAFDSRRSAILLIGGDKTVTIASRSGWCLWLTTYTTLTSKRPERKD
jgi:hypothetical protein